MLPVGLVASLLAQPAAPAQALRQLQNLKMAHDHPVHDPGVPAAHHQAAPILHGMTTRRRGRRVEVAVVQHLLRDLACL